MKLRQKAAAAVPEPQKAKLGLVAIQKPANESRPVKGARKAAKADKPRQRAKPKVETRGGYRPGAGRPPRLKKIKLDDSIYMSVTTVEKQEFEEAAAAENPPMTLSFYMRKRLGLPTEPE